MHRRNGLCDKHAQRSERLQNPQRILISGRSCTKDACHRPHEAKGLCKKHYLNSRRKLPKVRGYRQKYDINYIKRPDVVQRRLAYYKLPSSKARQKEYYRKNTKKRRLYSMLPETIERRKLYFNLPRTRELMKNLRHKRRAIYKETDITVNWLYNLRKETLYCQICNNELNGKMDLDHIVPIGKGGTHSMRNVRYVHGHCNKSRPKDGSDLPIMISILMVVIYSNLRINLICT